MSAPGIVAPETRDLDDLSAQLSDWIAARLPQANDVHLIDFDYPRGAGMSHETILFDARWTENGHEVTQGMVVRIKPTRHTVYLDDMFVEQYRLMELMHASGVVNVAKPLWFEPSADLLGAPFFVMEKAQGRVTVSYPPYSREGWMLDVAPADRRTLWEDSVRQLASIQKVPVEEAGFLHLPGEFAENFDQEVDRWRRYLDWVDPRAERALLRDLLDRLLAGKPANRPEGIVWGDSRLGNMMIGHDYKVAVVMDWEQPSLGGALHDLGWWLLSEENQTVAQGIAPLEGMGTRAETVELWEEVSGKSAADLDWYIAFASFKQDCLSIRTLELRGGMPGGATFEPGARTVKRLEALGL